MKDETDKIKPYVSEEAVAQLDTILRRTYDKGFDDRAKGRPRSGPTCTFAETFFPGKADLAADGAKKTVSVTSSADSSPAVLAERARKLQEDREKSGKPITNAEAVRIVYQEAGVSLE